jgi:hypothetical protein
MLRVRTAYRSRPAPFDHAPGDLWLGAHYIFAPEGCCPPQMPIWEHERWQLEVLDRMQAHHRVCRGFWDELLRRDEVTLTCDCREPEWCVRQIVARFLVGLGAEPLGEQADPLDSRGVA